MDVAMQYWTDFEVYMSTFQGDDVAALMTKYSDIPVYFVTLYLALVFYGQDWMKNREPFKMKGLFTLWNFILSTFSIVGAYYTFPVLLSTVSNKGLYFSVCSEPRAWYFNGATGFWTCAFILSKIPELIDTVFLVFQKKPVIFLHWYHHTTVMLYCWHAYVTTIGAGMWFAGMNFFVHSIMYTYYFMMNFSGVTRAIAKPFAQLITTLQLVQMVFGMGITVIGTYWRVAHPDGCWYDAANSRMGLMMYTSYFILFAALFKKLYLSPKSGKRKDKDSVCSSATEAMDTLNEGKKRQ